MAKKLLGSRNKQRKLNRYVRFHRKRVGGIYIYVRAYSICSRFLCLCRPIQGLTVVMMICGWMRISIEVSSIGSV